MAQSKLIVLERAIEMVAAVKLVADMVRVVDADLAKQMKRSSMSVAGQIGEAESARKGNKVARLQGALAEAKETKVHLRVAAAVGYVLPRDVESALGLADEVCAMLYSLVIRRRAWVSA